MDEFKLKIVNLAKTYKELDEFIQILESFSVPQEKKGDFFLKAGLILHKFSYFTLALNSWDHALKYFLEGNDKSGESNCYGNLGNAHFSLGDLKKAIEYYEKSLEIAIAIGDISVESTCYGNLGNAHFSLGDFRKAIKYYKRSLRIAEAIGDSFGESICYTGIGLAYDNLSHFGRAIKHYEKSLKITKENGDSSGESKCYTNLGNAYQSLGDFKKAIVYHEKSLEIKKEIGDKSGESTCYTNLGNAYFNLGDFGRAIEYHEKSLMIAKAIGDRSIESKCYGNLGIAFNSLGDSRRAIEYHVKSLEIKKEIGDKSGELACYTNLGIAYFNLGDFGRAIEYHEKSLKITKENGDSSGESKCYTNLGNAYRSLGDFRKAIEYHEKSLEIAEEIGDKSGESTCYGNLGNAHFSLGDFREAIKYYKRSLRIAEEIGDKSGESKCYGNLGNAHFSLGDFREAIKYYKRSLRIAEEIGDKSGESNCYTNLGNAYRSLGDLKKAIEYYEKSLEIDKEIGDINSERIVNLNLYKIYYESEKESAYKYCKHSIELSEMIGRRLVEEEKMIMFSTQTSDAYQYMIPLCLDLKKEKEAFDYTESSKSRVFLDMLAATEIRPTVEITGELKSLLHEEQLCLNEWREIQTRHLRQTRISVEPGEVESIRGKLDQIYDQIEQIDSEYVYARKGGPLTFDKAQEMLSSQERNVVIIEYFATKEKTLIFTLSSVEKRLHVKTVPLSEERLLQYTQNYLREVVDYPDSGNIGQTWVQLSEYLIDPVSEYLAEDALIYFVPYGVMHYLPLHALEFNSEPLIKRHPVAYVPSASLLRFCQNKGSNNLQSCASFGVVFEEEAEDVADLFNTKAYSGLSVSKDIVVRACTSKDIIHFSCHGYFDNTDPLSSGIVLHNGAVLTAREIFDLRLNTELVTLSACETGLSRRSPGDELIGLTRAFLYAGAPSVVVSLWSVDGRSTHDLMLEFYKQIKKGADKATSLQQAQIKVMEKEEYSHPYYWAPFVLVGDWQ